LEKGLGKAWTPAIADAWNAAYETLSAFMISEAYAVPRLLSKEGSQVEGRQVMKAAK
jgi:hemoglobin-like flavoprotein